MGEGRVARANELRRRAETHIASAGWLSARELLTDALAIYGEEKSRGGEAQCLRGLGDVAFKLGDLSLADEHYGLALVAAREAGDAVGEAEARARQADLHRGAQRHQEAAEALQAARELYRGAGHRRGEAQCLGILGELGREAGQPANDVLALYRQAHAIQMETGDLRGAGVTLGFMANFLRPLDPVLAAETYVQAARIYEGLGLAHRAEPLLAAARKLDPVNGPALVPRRMGPWDSEDD